MTLHGTERRLIQLRLMETLPGGAYNERTVYILDKQRRRTPHWMHFISCFAAVIFILRVEGLEPKHPDFRGAPEQPITATETSSGNCAGCHSCDQPTTQNPCLVFICTRHRTGKGPDLVPVYQGPDEVILDELENAYMPVPFDHTGHAAMAEMAGGCVACHHNTPTGEQHPACKTCHDLSPDQADIEKPALCGAYHQQCLNCHREWINEKDCDICHLEKADRLQATGVS